MRFDVRAVPPGAFSAWANGVRRSGVALDREAYAALAQPSKNLAPFAFGAVRPQLFEAIVQQTLPPAPGRPATDGES